MTTRLDVALAAQYAGDDDVAIDLFKLALREDECSIIHSHIAQSLRNLGQFPRALAYLNQSLERYPLNPWLLFQRALTHLQLGEWSEGWRDYEVRIYGPGHPARPVARKLWEGDAGDLLIYGEQGIGDEIMFSSILPDLFSRFSGKVFLETSPKLTALFRASFPQAIVFDKNDPCPGSPVYELPIGSLASLYRPDKASFPVHFGYLKTGPREPVEAHTHVGVARVGVSWRGGTRETRQAVRSIRPEQLIPALIKPRVQLVSLQHDATPDEIERIERLFSISLNHDPENFRDMIRLAARADECDLIVTVCSAVAHLGGALGIPTWVLTPYVPEWRYGFLTDSMPWYPSVTLHSQDITRSWVPVIERVARYFDFASELT